ncbi:hypothetical protein Q9Q99_07335 [Curtobacterium flaccumfaciens]|nr:hypothetical protein Q9Q99_07335 [Curtobacterium flaccumfaciens]
MRQPVPPRADGAVARGPVVVAGGAGQAGCPGQRVRNRHVLGAVGHARLHQDLGDRVTEHRVRAHRVRGGVHLGDVRREGIPGDRTVDVLTHPVGGLDVEGHPGHDAEQAEVQHRTVEPRVRPVDRPGGAVRTEHLERSRGGGE